VSSQPNIDLFDHRHTQNLWDVTREWRAHSPVVWPAENYAYVSRWEDCWQVLRDPVLFSNANGFKSVEVPQDERMLGEMDPPHHTVARRTMRRAFTRQQVEAERAFTRSNAERLFAELARRGKVDLVSEFSDQLPNLVTLHLLGFPIEDARQIVHWAKDLLHSDWPALNRTERGQGFGGAFPEFAGYIDALVDERRAPDAPDDFVSRLARSEIDGQPLNTTQLRILTAHTILGGISTSTNLLGSMLYRLIREPGLHAQLRARPEQIPAAVEESLRLDPPVLFVLRNCTRDTEIAGETIRAGQRVAAGIASANRDERVFDDPDSFRLDRGVPRHISFSGGAHLCMGAGLARLVGCETLGAFTRRFEAGDVTLTPGFRFEGVPVFLEYGPARLDVEFPCSSVAPEQGRP
jgi:cytochrome P450